MGLYENTQDGLKLIAGSTLYADMAVGSIIPFGGSVIPQMFLLCDGSAVSRTDYSELFAVIGTTFGAGDGSTTFNLPDLREAVPKGAGETGQTVGAHVKSGGLAVGEFLDDRMQGHYHKSVGGGNASGISTYKGIQYADGQMTYADNETVREAVTDGVNGTPRVGATTEVKSVGVNYIIKAKQVGAPADFIDAAEDYIDEQMAPIESDVTGLIDNANTNGCVNILPNEAVTQVDNGITYTVRNDGTVIANGTATATSSLAIKIKPSLEGYLPAKLSGCPAGGSLETYRIQYANFSNVDDIVLDFGNGGIIRTQFNYDTYPYARAMIRIESGQTVNNLEFRPMITLASQPDSDYNHYVPYSKTNKELTAEISNLAKQDVLLGEYTASGSDTLRYAFNTLFSRIDKSLVTKNSKLVQHSSNGSQTVFVCSFISSTEIAFQTISGSTSGSSLFHVSLQASNSLFIRGTILSNGSVQYSNGSTSSAGSGNRFAVYA